MTQCCSAYLHISTVSEAHRACSLLCSAVSCWVIVLIQKILKKYFREFAGSAPLQLHVFLISPFFGRDWCRYHDEIENGNSISGTNTAFLIVTLVPARIACALIRHFFLSLAHCFSSSQLDVLGASISKSPSLLCAYMCCTALNRSLYESTWWSFTSTTGKVGPRQD